MFSIIHNYCLLSVVLMMVILNSQPSSISRFPFAAVNSQLVLNERTRTVTYQVLKSGSLVVVDSDTAALRFQKAGIFPNAFVKLEILNSTFTTFTQDCQASLKLDEYATLVTGPNWLSSELLADVPLTQPSETSNTATLHFKASALFDARTNVADKSVYTVRLPSTCTSQQISAPTTFQLTETPSTQLAGILAFTLLLAGTLGFMAVLGGGSAYAYVPVQLAVLLTSCGCGPIDLQAESYTVLFTVSPLPYMSRSRMPHYNMLLTNLLIFLVLTVVEAIHFAIRWLNTEAYAPRLIASLKGRRDVFLSSYKPQPDETRPIPQEDIPKRPMPFYLLFAIFITLGTGTFFHAVRVLTVEAKDIKHYGAAGVGIIVWFLFFAFCLSLSLTKGAYFVNYATSKKKLPSFITPAGCVGPNVFRLSFGPVVNDMRQNRRAFSTFPTIYLAIIAILVGATQPSATSCRTTLSICWLVTFLFGIFLYRSRPLRSILANAFAVTSIIAAIFTISSQLMYGGYGGNVNGLDHWSGRMGVISLIVLGIVSIFNSIVSMIVAFWEGVGGEAQRTAKYSDGLNGGGAGGGGGLADLLGGGTTASGETAGATGAEQFERHVAYLLSDMKQIIEDGGGQPLEPDDHFVPGVAGGGGGGASARRVGAGGSSHLQAPSLSQFLLQDFDALPQETQESIVTSERIAKQAQARSTVPFSYSGRKNNNKSGRRSPSQVMTSPSTSYL